MKPPMGDIPVRCRSCRAQVLWVNTTTGKAMPLDRAPVPGGNVVLTGRTIRLDEGGAARPEARVEPEGETSLFDPGDRYLSHFATCPQADEWRRGR